MRVKTGTTRKRRHKKILAATKGFRMTKSKLYKVAHESYMHAGQYAYEHRQKRAGQIRKVWTARITAAAELNGTKYSKLMNQLKIAKVGLNRKVLADLAYNHPDTFSKLVQSL